MPLTSLPFIRQHPILPVGFSFLRLASLCRLCCQEQVIQYTCLIPRISDSALFIAESYK